MMNRIFFLQALFALLVTLAAGAAPRDEGVAVAASGPGTAGLREELYELDRQLAGLFPTGSRQPGMRCRITVSPQTPPDGLQLEAKKDVWEITYNPEELNWNRDFRLRRELTGILLAARLGMSPPDGPGLLPDWLIAAIDARRDARRGAERMMRSNRYYPITRALLEAGLPLPSFRQLVTLDPTQIPPGCEDWHREFSRLLLEAILSISQNRGLLLEYVRARMTGEAGEPELFDRILGLPLLAEAEVQAEGPSLPPAEKLQRNLTRLAREMAWQRFFPRPSRLSLRDYREARKVRADDPAAPDGGRLYPYEDLPGVLLDLPRKEAAVKQRAEEAKIAALALYTPTDIGNRIQELLLAIGNLPFDRRDADAETRTRRFHRALEELDRTWRFRVGAETYLDDYARRNAPVNWLYFDRFRAVSTPSPLAAPEIWKFLRETERHYLEE